MKTSTAELIVASLFFCFAGALWGNSCGEWTAYEKAALAKCDDVCESQWRVIDKKDKTPSKWSCRCATVQPPLEK